MPTSFELVLNDTSPIINYYPFAETQGAPDVLAGWNSYFSQSGFLSEPGQTGEGTSAHVTSLDGATLTIEWFGTGISLFGTAFDAGYEVSIDGGTSSIGLPRGGLLAEFQDLETKQHLITLVAHPSPTPDNPSSYIAFNGAALNITTKYLGATVSSEFIDATDSRWVLAGDWMQFSDSVLDSEPSQDYCLTTTQGNVASILFDGSAVAVTGIRYMTNGHYNVTLDGKTTTFNGHSNWLEPSALFLQAGLDETIRHLLTITNVDDASLAIAGLNVTHVSKGTLPPESIGSPSHHLSPGSIIALILGGLAGFLAFGTLLIACVYARRDRSREPGTAVPPGLSTASYLRDFTMPNHPPSPKRQPMHDDILTERSPQPLLSRSAKRDGHPTVVTAPSRRMTIDPTSPSPYLRVPNSSGPTQRGFKTPYGNHQATEQSMNKGQPDRGRIPPTISKTELMQEMINTRPYTNRQNVVVNSVPEIPARARNRPKSSKRSSSVDGVTARILHEHVASPKQPETSARTSFLLLSPVRPLRPGTRRSVSGPSHMFKGTSGTSPSSSTMQFVRPRRRSGGASELTVEVSPPLHSKESDASALLERLRAYRTSRDPPSAAPKRPPIWKPW